jgi:hypothetical protein
VGELGGEEGAERREEAYKNFFYCQDSNKLCIGGEFHFPGLCTN